MKIAFRRIASRSPLALLTLCIACSSEAGDGNEPEEATTSAVDPTGSSGGATGELPSGSGGTENPGSGGAGEPIGSDAGASATSTGGMPDVDPAGTGGSTGGVPMTDPNVPVSAGEAQVQQIDDAAQLFNNQVREFSYTSNSAPHQQNALVVFDGFVFVVYFDEDGSLVLARRALTDGASWVRRTFPASHDQTDPDSHRTANIAVSPNDRRLHIMWGHHADKLRYVVTRDENATLVDDADFQTNLFEGERQYLNPGQNLTRVCYPRMFVGEDSQLQVVWRDEGGSGNAHSYISTYQDDKTWSPRRMIINGKVGTYDGDGNRNAYFNDIGYRNGVTHVSWTWRENAKSQDGLITNHDLHYAFSPDAGATWFNRLEEVVGNTSDLTMNLGSKDVKFRTLDYTKRVENQTGQAIDRAGRVHMLFRHDNAEGDKTLFHYFKFDGAEQIHMRERSELASSIRPKIYADPTDNNEDTLYVVTIASSKLKVYGANKGDAHWGEWITLYSSEEDYLTATAQIADDGRTLHILAQRRPANLETGTSSGLDLITLPVMP